MERDLKKIISEMTLEEKAGMCSGEDFWRLKKVERLGIPEVMVSDGPHGLRKQPGEALSADGILNIYPRIHILQAKWLLPISEVYRAGTWERA